MINILKASGLIAVALLLTTAFAAEKITGTVHNMTTGQAAAGDEVVLLRLGEGMREEARTRTDAKGAFILDVPALKGPYLIQVTHQGVQYDQSVSGSGEVTITVYDTVTTIPGLSGPMGIAQVASDGKVFKITEMYDIRNNSDPPVTQSRPDNFEITVPPDAEFDSAEARRGQGIWLKVKPEPVKGRSGKFALNFPIRPGDTLFRFTYHVPNRGHLTLHLRVPYPIEKFGVMHPSSMRFKASRPNDFKSGAISSELRGELAVARPTIGEVPAFEITGVGSAPEHGAQGNSAAPVGPSNPPAPAVETAPTPSNSQGAIHSPAPSTPTQSSRELWLIIGATVVLLGISAYVFIRMKRKPAKERSAGERSSAVEALKEELFQLESERVHGSISPEEYAATRDALNKSIERALTRMGRQNGGTPTSAELKASTKP